MNKVLRLPINHLGRDIVVADPHGEFALLKQALKAIAFNTNQDRLFIAGDLVDKGKNSIAAAQWVQKPYCYGVIGNHDAQYIFQDELSKFSKSLICAPIDPWFINLGKDELTQFGKLLKTHLYPAIEIETASGLVGIVHGEVPESLTWPVMVNRLNKPDYDLLRDCIWDRSLANKAIRGLPEEEQRPYFLNDVQHVFHGHSPAKKLDFYPYRLANRYYIDTAAYKSKNPDKYPTAGITLFDATQPERPLYTTGNRALVFANSR